LRERGCRDILAYGGYTYERLRRMAEDRPAIGAVLDEIEMLVDGPFVQALANQPGLWTGSANQRFIDLRRTRRRATSSWGCQ
jgi:anaerobic ribonucleoside-triphosphate reductase activating protein